MNDMSSTDRALAESAYEATEDELLISLGAALAGSQARDEDPQNLSARAEAWFRRNHERLRSTVCGHPALADLTDSFLDVAALADILSAHLNRPTAFTVAAIILKRGVNTWCA
ncbi:MAG: hypothetical protein IPL36_09745 [Nigerium sp.]|nr:hypothetical protein [Nigerium sp.]